MARKFTDPSYYINRELSWLEFNARVLHEALDSRNPLLERLKFLAIFSTNLDEFYMVRVAGLRRQVAEESDEETPDGLTAMEQIEAIAEREAQLRRLQMMCLHTELLPLLAEHGVEILSVDDLTKKELVTATEFFERQVFPILTPIAIDSKEVAPHISNLALSLAVELLDPGAGENHFAIMEVPRMLPRWVKLGDSHRYVPLERVIGMNLDMVFTGLTVLNWGPFRITRDAELDLPTGQYTPDPLSTVEEHVFRRRFGEVSRLEVPSQIPEGIRSRLLDEMCDEDLPPCVTYKEKYVHEAESLLQLGDFMQLASLDLPELRYPPLADATPPVLEGSRTSIFDTLRERDILVHHPFDSFATTVEEFIEEAAEDENVLAIKLTLYRTSADTEILRALASAAERGTQVVVVVELKARFDEAPNVRWARMLENSGVHAVFGIGELKTHAKLALVVRRDPDGLRRYVHIGTGNYNSRTARQYTDVGLFTSDSAIGADVSSLFNRLTGFSHNTEYKELNVAPEKLREKVISLIRRETERAKAGRPARIIAKMNSLSDIETIKALYAASAAGVEIDLMVRGICCLRPGLARVSENIRVQSIVGRFLEHSRVWAFENGGEEEVFIGSADWMERNFDRRVEAVVQVKDHSLAGRLKSLLLAYLADRRNAWDLNTDGTYTQRMPDSDDDRSVHDRLMNNPWGEVPPDDESPDTAEPEWSNEPEPVKERAPARGATAAMLRHRVMRLLFAP